MNKLKLSVTMGNYDRIRPLIDGGVQIDGMSPVFMLQGPGETFSRTFRHADYDICKLSFSSYSVKTAADTLPHTAVSVFPSYASRHNSTYVRADHSINRPEDLKGKCIGVSGYQLTANAWIHMFLEEEYGMKTSDIRWVRGSHEDPTRVEKISPKLPEGAILEDAPEGKTVSNPLAKREIDGVIGLHVLLCFDHGYPQARHLFDDPQRSTVEWYERRKLFLIMHTLDIRKALAKQHPQLPGAMAKAFEHSKEVVLARLSDTSATKVALPFIEDQLRNARHLMDYDFWSCELANNKHVIDRFLAQHHVEGPSSRRFQPAKLFHSASLESFRI